MEQGQKLKLVSIVNDLPLKLYEVYEGEYYYGYSQEMLHSRRYDGYKVVVDGTRHHFSTSKFIPLAEYRDLQLNELLTNNG